MNEILIEAFRQKDWATKVLIAACADRSVDELTRPAPGFGSILATLNHQFLAYRLAQWSSLTNQRPLI